MSTPDIPDKDAKLREMFYLLLEARDALPAISLTSAKLMNIRLDLADRIEACLEPWQVKDEAEPTNKMEIP